ncbi:hypothetical protein [Chitinophaga sp. MM2321]|uniref:hypothetical protein n=1 Tax=Chitinophaga sp. MM2321 TaxID=3137178 RepID=UPI0032D592C9
MDFSKTLFRSSSIGHIMTEPQSKAAKDRGELSEGAKTHLIDVYVSRKYGRQTDIFSKYLEKGLAVEEDSITLFSRVKRKYYKKNETHLKNDFIMGTPDLYEGVSINEASLIVDIKSSWDIFTFFRNLTKPINKDYYWQLMAYMALTGAKKATLAYCLVNTPELMIVDEERKLMYRMNAGTTENPLYIEACEKLRQLSIYDDIPMNRKIIEFSIDRNDEEIERIYSKVKKCREYLNELEASICEPQTLLQ